MARPKANVHEITNRLLGEAEKLLEETHGRRLILSEVADRVGISQSYAHRFFPRKADLVRALAQRWFDQVECESRRTAALGGPADERLEKWVLTLLRVKRDRYDENPALFRAYLDLAAAHMDLVSVHTRKLQADLICIVADMVSADELDDAVRLVEDATILFRTPHNIARHRQMATDDRARAVVRMLTQSLVRTAAAQAPRGEANG